jgi:hypothetical protein
MPDNEAPKDEPSKPEENEDPDLFGIDLGHRGVRPDEVDPRDVEPPPRVRPATRTLTDRLASAAADRNDAAASPADDEPESED